MLWRRKKNSLLPLGTEPYLGHHIEATLILHLIHVFNQKESEKKKAAQNSQPAYTVEKL
jgi:hypothetical protein